MLGVQMNLVPQRNPGQSRLLLLAPPAALVPDTFQEIQWDPSYYADVLASSQQLRGQAYFEDGAIHRSELEPDGRFIQDADEHAWHLVTVNARSEVTGCARYLAHSGRVRYSDLGVAQSPLGWSPEWSQYLRAAVESEIELANRFGVDYVEVGGWALSPEIRCTNEALRIALGMFSVARLLGGCIGITTATRRHCSSSILRRIGGQSLNTNGLEIPRYFDPRYDCQMEILRFDSAQPNPRFEIWIEELRNYLAQVPVLQGTYRSSRVFFNAPAHSAA